MIDRFKPTLFDFHKKLQGFPFLTLDKLVSSRVNLPTSCRSRVHVRCFEVNAPITQKNVFPALRKMVRRVIDR